MTVPKSKGWFDGHSGCCGMLRILTKVMLYAAGRANTVEKVML